MNTNPTAARAAHITDETTAEQAHKLAVDLSSQACALDSSIRGDVAYVEARAQLATGAPITARSVVDSLRAAAAEWAAEQQFQDSLR